MSNKSCVHLCMGVFVHVCVHRCVPMQYWICKAHNKSKLLILLLMTAHLTCMNTPNQVVVTTFTPHLPWFLRRASAVNSDTYTLHKTKRLPLHVSIWRTINGHSYLHKSIKNVLGNRGKTATSTLLPRASQTSLSGAGPSWSEGLCPAYLSAARPTPEGERGLYRWQPLLDRSVGGYKEDPMLVWQTWLDLSMLKHWVFMYMYMYA